MAERDKIGEAVLRADEFIDKRPIAGEVSAIDVDFSRVISGYDLDIPLDVPYYGMRPGRYVLDERDMADEGGAVYATSRDQIVNHAKDPEKHQEKDPEKHQDVMATSLDVEAAEAWAREGIDPQRLYTIKGGISLAGVLASVARVISILIALEKAHKRNQSAQRKKRARKSNYSRKESGNVTNAGLTMTSGPLTNALMGRGDGCIAPESYFSQDSVKVNTGAGGYVMLDVRAGDETDIDAAYREYRLNDRDRFWLDPLYTLAIENGRQTIEGSEILKLRGYANPYADSAATTMADALKSISKAISTRVAIDVTSEKRNRRKGNARLVSSTRLQPVVSATVDLDKYEDENGGGVKDFTINLQTPDPIDALPLAKYERARKMLTTVSASDFDFKSVRKLTTDDRQMWSYVLRIIKSNKLSSTILFETMWRNLELREPEVSPYAYMDRQGAPLDKPAKDGGVPVAPEDAPRADAAQIQRRAVKAESSRRDRMVKKLEKMLDDKSSELFKGWTWHKDGAGRVDGVTITRKKN